MRIPKIENYKNENIIDIVEIKEVPEVKRQILLMNDKDKIKFIKRVERVVRSSQEYKDYIQYLRNEIDMTSCSFFHNINNKESRKISIEIHHEPFSLFDITQIVVEKWIHNDIPLNPLLIAEEVLKLHYQGKVGLIPLSVTVHELLHDGKIFIPLQNVYGDFISFLEEYDQYITQDLKSMLECKLRMSKEINTLDLSILEKKYVYLQIDGMSFPQPISVD